MVEIGKKKKWGGEYDFKKKTIFSFCLKHPKEYKIKKKKHLPNSCWNIFKYNFNRFVPPTLCECAHIFFLIQPLTIFSILLIQLSY